MQLQFKAPWRDGITHQIMTPLEFMQPLTALLQSEGRPVFSYAFGKFNTRHFEESARGLIARARAICDELDTPRVDLVGYSMGGLVGLHALKFLDGQRWIRSLIMLGTPVRGSHLGWAGIATMGALSHSVWQIVPGSSYLAGLRAQPLPAAVRVSQVHAASDGFCPVTPRLPEVAVADYEVIAGVHASLIVSPAGHAVVRRMLAENDPLATTLPKAEHAQPDQSESSSSESVATSALTTG